MSTEWWLSAASLGGLVLGCLLVSLGKWLERRLNEAEFRAMQQSWEEHGLFGTGPRRLPGAHRRQAGRHRKARKLAVVRFTV